MSATAALAPGSGRDAVPAGSRASDVACPVTVLVPATLFARPQAPRRPSEPERPEPPGQPRGHGWGRSPQAAWTGSLSSPLILTARHRPPRRRAATTRTTSHVTEMQRRLLPWPPCLPGTDVPSRPNQTRKVGPRPHNATQGSSLEGKSWMSDRACAANERHVRGGLSPLRAAGCTPQRPGRARGAGTSTWGAAGRGDAHAGGARRRGGAWGVCLSLCDAEGGKSHTCTGGGLQSQTRWLTPGLAACWPSAAGQITQLARASAFLPCRTGGPTHGLLAGRRWGQARGHVVAELVPVEEVLHLCMHVCVCPHVYTCVHLCAYACICECMCACVCACL